MRTKAYSRFHSNTVVSEWFAVFGSSLSQPSPQRAINRNSTWKKRPLKKTSRPERMATKSTDDLFPKERSAVVQSTPAS